MKIGNLIVHLKQGETDYTKRIIVMDARSGNTLSEGGEMSGYGTLTHRYVPDKTKPDQYYEFMFVNGFSPYNCYVTLNSLKTFEKEDN